VDCTAQAKAKASYPTDQNHLGNSQVSHLAFRGVGAVVGRRQIMVRAVGPCLVCVCVCAHACVCATLTLLHGLGTYEEEEWISV
jgi:hypothetical protein